MKKKGEYGYLRDRKLLQAGKCLFVLAGIVILLMIGYHVTETRNNIMTVMAIVSALPLANAAVILFAALPYGSRPKEEYERIRELTGDGILDTELVMTRGNGKAISIDYAYVHPEGVFLFTADAGLDTEAAILHMQEILVNHNLYPKITIEKNLGRYEAKLKELEPVHREDCEERLLEIEGVLQAISL